MISLFPWIKNLHISTVIFTGSFFLLRYIWMLNGTLERRGKWVRHVSVINDTILLICGITMTTIIKQYPFVHGWLTAKVIALLGYIVFGSVALKYGKSLKQRAIHGVIALLCYGYIVSVALKHNPLPYIT